MNKPKVSTLILVIALVITSLSAVNLLLGRNAERARRVWAEDQIKKITQAKEALEKEKEELSKAKQALETQLADSSTKSQALETQARALEAEVEKEKRARQALISELAQAQRDSAELKGRLEAERREKLSLTEDLSKAKQSYQALSNELTTLRQAKEALEKRVKEMLSAKSAESGEIVVTPKSAPSQKALEGKVLVVNREYNFIVVGLGSRDGIKGGMNFSITRAGKLLGKAQVEKVYDNMCAANLLQEEQKGQIKEGDLVRLL